MEMRYGRQGRSVVLDEKSKGKAMKQGSTVATERTCTARKQRRRGRERRGERVGDPSTLFVAFYAEIQRERERGGRREAGHIGGKDAAVKVVEGKRRVAETKRHLLNCLQSRAIFG